MAGDGIEASTNAGTRVEFSVSDRGRVVNTGRMALDTNRYRQGDISEAPLVSCLMVTQDRPDLAARSIQCFLAQSYPNRELIIIDDGTSDQLQRGIEAICLPSIKWHRLPRSKFNLGELRNVAVENSAGRYVCQWDDDDLCDPDRLSVQMAAITSLSADACFLSRQQLWWPQRRTLAISTRRIWEGTMICAKDKTPRYPALRRGEDTPLAYHVWRTARVVMLDQPGLYTYVCHGANSFDESHFAQHFAAATECWTGDDYDVQLNRLGSRVPIDIAGALPGTSQSATEHDDLDRRSAETLSAPPVVADRGPTVRVEGSQR